MSGEVDAAALREETSIDPPTLIDTGGGGRDSMQLDKAIRERLRNDGLQTVTKLLTESRVENKILKEKNNQLERTVDNLSYRLQKSGISTGSTGGGEPKTSTSSNHDEDVNLPSSSRNLVENLIRENNRLKHQLHNPQKVDELNMRACNLQSLNNSLKEDRSRLEQELSDLKSMIHIPDRAKDKHIVRLVDELKSCKIDYQRERNHRLTLEGEISKLNDELTDTAQKCLNMRKQLPSSNTNSAGADQADSYKTGSEPGPTTISGNSLQHIAQAGSSLVFSERSLYDQNARLEERCNNLEQELNSLRSPMGSSSNVAEQLTAENRLLKEKLVAKDEEINRLKETCELLNHQLRVYQEDFKKEKKDRELTHQRYSQMEQHYKEIRSQMPAKLSQGNNAWDGRQQAANRPRATQPQQAVRFTSQTSKTVASKDNPSQVKSVSSKADGGNRSLRTASKAVKDDDNISLSSQTDLVRPTLPQKPKSELTCYRCHQRFGIDCHSELMDHLDVCDR